MVSLLGKCNGFVVCNLETSPKFTGASLDHAYKGGFPWASTTIKIMVDPISMIKTLRWAMVVILTPIVLMVVGISGVLEIPNSRPTRTFRDHSLGDQR